MTNDHLFPPLPYLQQKHRNKRGMPRQKQPADSPDLPTADLTSAILMYLKAHGCYAVRINCAGIFDERTGRWRRSTTERGTADIHACVRGRHVSIELKQGADALSARQRSVQRSVVKAGGTYLVVHDFSDFHRWFMEVR